MIIFKMLFAALLIVFLIACEGEDNAGNTTKTTPTPATSSIGRTQTLDAQPNTPQVNENLSAWLIQYGTNSQQIYLSTRTTPFSEGGNDNWALTFRIDQKLIPGTVTGSDMNVRLFSNYHFNCCSNPTDPYGLFETYDHSYAAVGGTVKFNSEKQAIFDLQMQEESPARSSNFVGPVFHFVGCWQIAGENAVSGCIIP